MIEIKKLIITEKPSVARDIASVLGQFNKKDGYLENQEYVISWAVGHLVELAEPHEYDQDYGKWNLEQLPIIPEEFVLKPVKSATKQLKVLKQLLNLKDITEVINACDAGREGESIFRRIYQFCQCNKPIKRLWLSETTPTAVKEAFSQLRDGAKLDNLASAAEARSQADWLVGINATRAFSVRHNAVLSVGRVQTPTLGLVVDREREIRNFKPVNYWELMATFNTDDNEVYKGKWTNGDKDRIFTKEELDSILTPIRELSTGVVTDVEQKETKEQPPMLFNLNDLQKEANRRYGLTAQQTLDIAQALYEKHKLLTYPRTDSRHLTTALADTVSTRLEALASASEYNTLIPKELPKLGKRYVDDNKVTDHHAIIPTALVPNLADLSKNERLVYELVACRFIAIFCPDTRYAVTKVTTKIGNEDFISKGKVELELGWKAVYKGREQNKADGEQEEQPLPALNKNGTVNIQQLETPEKQTKPPKRYTEATLLSAMENAGKLVEDDELSDSLKEAGGIGTPATRAAIIERLIKVSYIERQKKTLVPTEKGETLIDLVPEEVKSVELTAQWEERLKHIEQGKELADEWLQDIKRLTRDVVQLAIEQTPQRAMNTDKPALGICQLCGQPVVEGKKGYGCIGWREGCKFVIWKEVAGKKITEKHAKELLEKGTTGLIKGFKSKAGKTFDAMLKINQEGSVEFIFPEQKHEVLGKCPLCNQEVLETAKGYGCSGWKEGCKFVIWKEIAGKKITASQAKQLLEKKKTALVKGFKSRNGKQFDASLVMGDDGKVTFEFDRG